MRENSDGQDNGPTAALLIIGNEILSGRTKDANLPFIAEKLGTIGIRMMEVRVVPDIEAEIVNALNALRQRYRYVFTTGGIGPTHDDITAESIAKAFDVPLIRHPEAYRRLKAHYDANGLEFNAARLRMANTPEGAELIDNPVSVAPGFRIGNVHVMAGVPKIMQAMLEGILPTLQGGRPIKSRCVVCNLPEGTVADALGRIQKEFPGVDIGSYPSYSKEGFGISLVLRGIDEDELDAVARRVADMISELGGTPRFQNQDGTRAV